MNNIERLIKADEKVLEDINKLVLQLSSRGYQMTLAHLERAVANTENYIMVARDNGNIVGMGTLVTLYQMTGRKGYMEDVVVDEQYRGKGLGKKIVQHILEVAKEKGIESVELKSEPHRKAANLLYQRLGFEQKEANIYKVYLNQ